MGQLLANGRIQFTDGNGTPLAGGSVAFCQPGTSGTVYRPIYGDEAETLQLQNPVPLDSAGIPFSGGSQQTLWGFGAYEQFVRDNNGNLIYSAVIDTVAGFSGGTIAGSVQINGSLSVTGAITDATSITSPQYNGVNATFSGNVGVGGSFSANSVGTNLLVSNGALEVAGSAAITGTTATGELAINGGGTSQWNGASIGSVNNVTTQSLNIGSVSMPKIQGGVVTTSSGTFDYYIPFPVPMGSLTSASVTPSLGSSGGTFLAAVSIFEADGAHIAVQIPGPDTGETHQLYWMVIGF